MPQKLDMSAAITFYLLALSRRADGAAAHAGAPQSTQSASSPARAAAGSLKADAEDSDADLFDALRVTVDAAPACAMGEAVAIVKLADAPVRAALKAWVETVKAGGARGA
jgi:hypothetical protein